MKNSFVSLITFIIGVVSLQARNVTGIVLTEGDSTIISGASCILLYENNVVGRAISDINGAFNISTELASALKVEISFTGYRSTEILIPPGSKNIDLGRVFISEGITLDEVTVTADSEIDSRGRTIIYPGAAEVKASATLMSFFQKMPLAGLEVNPITRTINVDGGVPYILINGVPSTIDDINALQPKEIAKIEYSRVTPARYADKGTTGFVNIILKKHNDGGQVYLWGRSATATAFIDGNFKASYHQGASQFTVSYRPSWRNLAEVYDNSRESYIGDDFKVDIEEHDRNPFNYHFHRMQMKYDYTPNPATLFSVTFRATPKYQGGRTIGANSDSELGNYEYRNCYDNKEVSPSLDIFLRHNFNDKSSMEAQLVGTWSANDYHRANNYFYTDGTSNEYVMDIKGHRRSLISEISYSHDFNGRTQISGGFQNTLSRSTNTYLLSNYKPILTENNNYVYARLGQQIDNVYLSVSTGMVMFWIKNDLIKRNFIRNRTSAQVSWNIDKKWILAATFTYGPIIPSLAALTDYPQQVSPYLISNGSPNLKVADTFHYRFMPSFKYKKFSASLQMNFVSTPNNVIDDVIYLGDRKFISQSVNAKRSTQLSSKLNLRINNVHGFGVNAVLGVAHYNVTGERWSDKLTSFDGNFSLWWNRGPFTITYWRKFPGKFLNGHTVWRNENGDALQVEFQPGKHWKFAVNWMYMFETKGSKYPSWGYSATNPFQKERYIKDSSNMIVLSMSYSTSFGTIFRSGRRSLNNSDNGSSILKL